MNAKRVNEGTSSILTVSFFDESGQPFTPSIVSYRIEDLKSGTNVAAQTTIQTGQTIDIPISPTQNRLISRAHRSEPRAVVVSASYGGTLRSATAEYRYEVITLAVPPVVF